MVDILKKLKDNNIKMTILTDPFEEDRLQISFYKSGINKGDLSCKDVISFSMECIEKSEIPIEVIIGQYLDDFLERMDKKGD